MDAIKKTHRKMYVSLEGIGEDKKMSTSMKE